MSIEPAPKRRPGLALLSLIIGLVALGSFIFLNRMMAPPFPRFNVSPTAGLTNFVAASTNAATATNPVAPRK
jgi:hypothetical protein